MSHKITRKDLGTIPVTHVLAQPSMGRMVDGLARRVDRLKALGNGQVPLVAATAWRVLNAHFTNG